MKIRLNGKEEELAGAQNLQSVVALLGRDNRRIIAEVNGAIIKNPFWENTILKDGDSVELVQLVGGG